MRCVIPESEPSDYLPVEPSAFEEHLEEGNRLEAIVLANLLSITHTKNKERKEGRRTMVWAPELSRLAGRSRWRAHLKRGDVGRCQQFVHRRHRFGPEFAKGLDILLVCLAGARVRFLRRS